MGSCVNYYYDPVGAVEEGHLVVGDTKGRVVHFHFRSADQYLFDSHDRRQSGLVRALEDLPCSSPQCDRVETYGKTWVESGSRRLPAADDTHTPIMTCDVYAVHRRHPDDKESTEEVAYVR
jgi:hypothetical protein